MKAEYINHMGDDLTVVNAARVSMHKESDWEILHSFDLNLPDKDKKLISYLSKNGHWTPFSHPQIMMREKVPIFVARQRFKHMVGFTYNEVSRRYVDDELEFFVPDVWRKQAENVKQGSSDEGIPLQAATNYEYKMFLIKAEEIYNEMLSDGVAPEQARMVLPQSMYTEYYVTGSLAAWARAYKQRSDPHAQKEIRDLAVQWDEIIRPLFPVAWSALVD